jgi:hypothetical protein
VASLLCGAWLRIAAQVSTQAPAAQGDHAPPAPEGQVGGNTQQMPCGSAVQAEACGNSRAHEASVSGQLAAPVPQVAALAHSPATLAATPLSRRRQSFQ